MTLDYARWSEALSGERLPVAALDLDAFDRNARKMAELARAHGKALRLATKSVRVPALLRRVLELGAPFQGLMCYSAEEAQLLSREGFDDLLVAYPTLQRSDLAALRELHAGGRKVALVVDSQEGLARLAAAVRGTASPFPVVLELDASLRLLGGRAHLGVRRSPVRTREDLTRLLDAVASHPELSVRGVMAYEAQVAGLGDRNPFKRALNPLAFLVRRFSVMAIARRRLQVAELFAERGHELALFNGGGTGSLNLSAREPWLTEVSAGSGLYCPHLFDYYSNIRFEPALFFALQVVRASDPGFVTCQGGGYIASGEAGPDRLPRPWLPQGLQLIGAEGCGEVQTPLRLPAGVRLAPGELVLFRHAKAGELLERFNEVVLVSEGKIVGRAPTYRGLGLAFF
ncbi:MAG: alanine racemase [Oligoflexia bacterium]|nr:alanine racemase [Oligoflexia bacterium]